MNYKETIEYLFSQLPVYQNVGGIAYKEGLDNSLALDEYFNHPHTQYKTIHVGGTNGKGSTSHLLAAILQESGYKVGLYTSPHLLDFRERIRVNGVKISEQYVIDFVEKHKHYYEPIHPSFFELTMMMAFCYFADEKIDIAVIEVGLGGRLDSTNIITPILSVITNISLDHIQYLGNTVEKIATEKAGIIKSGVPVVIGEAEQNIRDVFSNKATSVNAPIAFAQDKSSIVSYQKQGDNSWLFQTERYPNLRDELGGLPQVYNANTVLTAIQLLEKNGLDITDSAVYEGFSHVTTLTGLMGRWQIVKSNNPCIICDTGHNVGGIKYISTQLSSEKYNQLRIVIGMVNDKDINHVLELLPRDATYYFTRASISRALDEKELSRRANEYQLEGYVFATVEEALDAALDESVGEDLIFIGGSNFIVAEALSYLSSNGLIDENR